ncbi:MAG: ATP-binding protein, partial [Chloroflexota bacterium]
MSEIIGSIAGNIALLIALTYLYGQVTNRQHTWHATIHHITTGLLFGLFAVINMLNPLTVAPGIILDDRVALIFVATLLAGWVGGAVAVIPVALYRILLGGAGMAAGVATLITPLIFGAIYYRARRGDVSRYRETVPLILSVTVLNVLLTYLLIPGISADFLFRNIFLPLLGLHLISVPLILWVILRSQQYRTLQQQVHHSEQRFRAIFDQSHQFIGLLKRDGTIIEVNRAVLQLASLPIDQIAGKPVDELPLERMTTTSWELLHNAIRQASNGEFVRFNMELEPHEDQQIVLDFSVTPIRGDTGKVVLLIAEGRDITDTLLAEQRRLELEIANKRNQLMRDFITNTSHHMRTPITIVRSTLDLCRMKAEHYSKKASKADSLEEMRQIFDDQMADMQRRIDTVDSAVGTLKTTINDMLEISRLDATETLTISRFNLTELVNSTAARYTADAQTRDIRLNINLPPTPITISGSPTHLQQMFENIIDNALHYTPPGGTVSVGLTPQPQSVTVEIADTGVGIPTHQQPHIFEEFYRTDEGMRMNETGVGLGLAYARRVARRHRGSIEVSGSHEEGTCFRIKLPTI